MKTKTNTEIKAKSTGSLKNSNRESGFTIIEATVALTILTIVLLGVVGAITFAVKYNHGNNQRSQALAVLQQEVELYRSAKFTPTVTDTILSGGAKTDKPLTLANGSKFVVSVKIDDDPFTANVQTDATKTLKEVTVTVKPVTGQSSWVTSADATVIFRRVKAN